MINVLRAFQDIGSFTPIRLQQKGPSQGLRNILVHASLCIISMLLTALKAIKLGKPEQIRAITSLT